jgi:hypothetical protein
MSYKIDSEAPFFPQVTITRPRSQSDGFENVVVGGLSLRTGIALQLLQGLMANPALAGVKSGKTLVQIALKGADLFIALADSTPPSLESAPDLE